MSRKPTHTQMKALFRSALWQEGVRGLLLELRGRNLEQLGALRPGKDDFSHAVGLVQGRIAQIDALASAEFEQAVLDWLKDNS